MVKGISRQVILVQGPDPKLFEQAIFILREDAQEGVTDEALLKEAHRLVQESAGRRKGRFFRWGPLWAVGGALATGVIWAMTLLF
jgi:hypothetical protein